MGMGLFSLVTWSFFLSAKIKATVQIIIYLSNHKSLCRVAL